MDAFHERSEADPLILEYEALAKDVEPNDVAKHGPELSDPGKGSLS